MSTREVNLKTNSTMKPKLKENEQLHIVDLYSKRNSFLDTNATAEGIVKNANSLVKNLSRANFDAKPKLQNVSRSSRVERKNAALFVSCYIEKKLLAGN